MFHSSASLEQKDIMNPMTSFVLCENDAISRLRLAVVFLKMNSRERVTDRAEETCE